MTDITTAGIPLPGSPSAGPSPTMAQMPVTQLVAQDPATPEYERPGYWKQRIIESEQRQAETWNLTMRAAIGADPGVAAEADKLARQLGQPLLKAQEDPSFLRAVSVMKRMTDDRIQSTNPVLFRSFQGLEFARKAWDDYEHLSGLERWGNAYAKGALMSERGRVASTLALGGDNLQGEAAVDNAAARRRFVEIEQEMAKLGPTVGFFNNAGEILGQWGSQLPRAFGAGLAVGAVTGAVGMVAPPAAPLTFAAGFKAGFTAQLAVDVMRTEGGNAYADMVQAGYDPQRAFWAASGVGVVNSVLELAGASIATRAVRTEIAQRVTQRAVREVARDIPGGFVSGYLREYGKGIAGEVTTELLQEMTNIVAEGAAAKGGEKDMSPDGIAARLWEVASKTVQGMAVLGIPGGVVGGMRAKVAQDAAKDAQERLREGQNLGAASKLNQRDSEAASGFVGQVLNQGGIREAHVDAATLRDVLAKVDAEATAAGKLQKSALDILESIVPGVAEQLQQALEVGGDVSVPLGDFVTRIQAEMPEFAAAIGPNVRLDPDSPTLDTADKAQAEKQADAADTGTEEQAAFYAALKKVEVEATAKIIETGGAQLAPEQVRTVAKVYAAAIETVAREERIDPAEAVKRYGATFEKAGAEQQGDVLSQPLKTKTPEFKAWFGESKVVDDSGAPKTLFRGTKQRSPKTFRGLVFFTDTQATADAYARSRSGADIQSEAYWSRGKEALNRDVEGRITEAYVAIQKPLDLRTDAGLKVLADLQIDEMVAVEMAESDALRDTVVAMRSAESIKKRARAVLEGNGEAWELTTKAWTPAWELAIVPALKRIGYDGLVLNDAVDTPGTTWAAFDSTQIKSVNNRGTFSPTDPNILNQQDRGYFDPKRLAVMFTDGTDVSTVLHELTHWFVEVVERLDRQGSAYGKAQFDVLLARWGKTREQWAALDFKAREPMLEDISYNAEEYFATGEAPSEELRGVFGKLRSFIVGLYRNVRAVLAAGYLDQTGRELPAMTPELRGFFDRMLAADSAIEAENALRAGAARLSDAAVKAIGADEETVAEIRELEQRQTDEAKEHLTAEAVRGARFFQAGRRNAEKDTRKKLAQAKAKIRKEVEDSLATNPVQAAFQYFRDGLVDLIDGTREFDPAAKKLDSASLRAFLGLPPVKGGEKAPSLVARIRELGGINPEGYPGDLRGEHRIVGVFRKEGGESFERIAQVLAAEGYGGEVYDGALAESVDSSWLVDAIKDAAQGVTLYPSEFVSDSTRMQAEYEAWAKSKSPEADEDVRARRRQQNEGERLYLRLARRRLVQKDGFSDLDAGAKMFGFESAEEMLNGLANAPLREEAIRAETNRRLEAEEPLANPDNFKRAVEEALHGKTAARLLSTILRAMMQGTRESVAGLEAQAKEAARVAMLRTPVGRINVRSFALAERRAAQQRDRALASGDMEAARDAHRRLLVQHYLTIGAAKVEREIERALSQVDKRFGKADQEIIDGKRNLDIVNAGRLILGRFGLFPEQRTEAARADLETMARLDPDGWQSLRVRIALATENAKAWRMVPLDEFRTLVATADGMWSESHRSEQIRIAGVMRAVQGVRDELEDQTVQTFGGGVSKFDADGNEQMASGGKISLNLGHETVPLSDWSWGAIEASLSRLEAWTVKMDGGTIGGAWHRYVYRPLKDATVAKDLEVAEHAQWFRNHLAKFDDLAGEKIDLRKFLGDSPHAVFENRAALIGALHHMGTESNFRNFILGHGFGEQVNGQLVTRWGDALQYAADKGWLKKRDFDLVQQGIDYINENFRDRLFITTREVWGFYPDAVEAMPFDTPFGRYPGGYFPSKVDKRYSRVGIRQQLQGVEQGRDEFARANRNVPRGVTISRVENSVEKRVTDLNMLPDHVDSVLSIIHLQPALSDIARLFRGRQNTMSATLSLAQPYAERRIILPALERMARDSIVAPTDSKVADAANWVRQSASLFYLGFNPRNAAQQFTGLANAIPLVGSRVWPSFWETWRNPRKSFRNIEDLSDGMRNRWSEAMQLAAADIKQMLAPSTTGNIRTGATRAAFFLQRYAQMMTDATIWRAAYEKEAAAGVGHEEAVQRADAVVRITQGEKTPLDVAPILSGNAIAQLFTQFGDYPNTVLNQNLSAPAGRRLATLTWTLLVPTLASSAIGLTMAFGKIGKGDRDDEDYNERLVRHLLGDQIRGAFGLVPIVGGTIGSAMNRLYGMTNDPGGMRNQPFAGWSVLEMVGRTLSGEAKFSDLLAVTALGAGLPARPAVNVVRYQERVAAGKEEQGDLLDYVRVLFSGR